MTVVLIAVGAAFLILAGALIIAAVVLMRRYPPDS